MSLSLAERHKLLAHARRETIDGITVLHLAGTPYAIGARHGALCRDDIAAPFPSAIRPLMYLQVGDEQ